MAFWPFSIHSISCVDLNILHLDDVICHKNKRYRISHDLLKNLNKRKFDSEYTLRCWYHWSYKINSIQLNILLLFHSQQTKYSLAMYGNANAWVHWNLSFSHRHLTIMRTPCVRTRTRWLFKSSDIMWHEKKNMQQKRSFINRISRCKSHAYLQKRWKDLSVCVWNWTFLMHYVSPLYEEIAWHLAHFNRTSYQRKIEFRNNLGACASSLILVHVIDSFKQKMHIIN